jgi:hypothetical protein
VRSPAEVPEVECRKHRSPGGDADGYQRLLELRPASLSAPKPTPTLASAIMAAAVPKLPDPAVYPATLATSAAIAAIIRITPARMLFGYPHWFGPNPHR